MLVKVTVLLSHRNCICRDVKSHKVLPTSVIHGAPKMTSMSSPIGGRRKASI
jgi:hypothetical protein